MTTTDYTKDTSLPICQLCNMHGQKDEKKLRTFFTHATEGAGIYQSATDWCLIPKPGYGATKGDKPTMANRLAKK